MVSHQCKSEKAGHAISRGRPLLSPSAKRSSFGLVDQEEQEPSFPPGLSVVRSMNAITPQPLPRESATSDDSDIPKTLCGQFQLGDGIASGMPRASLCRPWSIATGYHPHDSWFPGSGCLAGPAFSCARNGCMQLLACALLRLPPLLR
jgi:hypothetical protein